MLTVLIDESGTLPDLKDKFVVLCGVSVMKIKEAKDVISREISLVLDKHFHREIDQEKFNMVAGAVLWKYHDKDLQFYNLIKENIVVEKIINWPELKKKGIRGIKKLT